MVRSFLPSTFARAVRGSLFFYCRIFVALSALVLTGLCLVRRGQGLTGVITAPTEVSLHCGWIVQPLTWAVSLAHQRLPFFRFMKDTSDNCSYDIISA